MHVVPLWNLHEDQEVVAENRLEVGPFHSTGLPFATCIPLAASIGDPNLSCTMKKIVNHRLHLPRPSAPFLMTSLGIIHHGWSIS